MCAVVHGHVVVVEDRDGHFVRIRFLREWQESDVVLPPELAALGYLAEVAAGVSFQSPHDVAALVDEVKRPGVSRVDEVVVRPERLDAVDVKPVQWDALVDADAAALQVRLRYRNVLLGAPLEEHLACAWLQLEDHAVEAEAVFWAAQGRQVCRRDVVGAHEQGVALCEDGLVEVDDAGLRHPVWYPDVEIGTHGHDLVVLIVEDGDVAVPVPDVPAFGRGTRPVREDLLTLEHTDAEVGYGILRSVPHELPLVRHDQGGVLLDDRGGAEVRRGHEEHTRREGGAGGVDLHDWRVVGGGLVDLPGPFPRGPADGVVLVGGAWVEGLDGAVIFG